MLFAILINLQSIEVKFIIVILTRNEAVNDRSGDSNSCLIRLKMNLIANTTEDLSSVFGNWNASLANTSFNLTDIHGSVDFFGEAETYWMFKVIIVCS